MFKLKYEILNQNFITINFNAIISWIVYNYLGILGNTVKASFSKRIDSETKR